MAERMAGQSTAPDSLAALLRSATFQSRSRANVPEDLENPASSSHAQLLSLTSQSLTNLRAQPASLSAAKVALDSQLSTLCSRHVVSFVRVHTATAALPGALERLEGQLDTLIEHDLPALSRAIHHFPQQIEAPLTAKDCARNLLNQYEASLKDLLDIPRLLATCARSNHPIEALQLGIHMARIARFNRDGNDGGRQSVILEALKQECRTHLIHMRNGLLRGLGVRGVRLPAARRYVSLLQRLHDVDQAGSPGEDKLAISYSTMCLSFLRSRWGLVEELGAHEMDDDPVALLASRISSWRDVVGDSCTIALALFVDRSDGDEQMDELSPLSLIASFGCRAIFKLEQLIARSLPQVGASGDPVSLQRAFGALATLNTQLSYTAAALSRHGLDFSNTSKTRLAFEERSLDLWSMGLAHAIKSFELALVRSSTLSVGGLSGSMDARRLLAFPLDGIIHESEWSAEAARFPPLATLVNGWMDVYEALLFFAPLSIGKGALARFERITSNLIAKFLDSMQEAEADGSALSTDIDLDPLRDGGSSASDEDVDRSHEALLAVAARFVAALCGPIVPAVRAMLLDTFEMDEEDMSPELKETLQEALTWARSMDDRWRSRENDRREEAEEQWTRHVAREAAKERQRVELRRKAEEEEEEEEERRREDEARVRAECEEQVRLEDARKAEERRRQAEANDRARQAAEEQRREQAEDRGRKKSEEAAAAEQRHKEAASMAATEEQKREAEEERRNEAELTERRKEQEEHEEGQREADITHKEDAEKMPQAEKESAKVGSEEGVKRGEVKRKDEVRRAEAREEKERKAEEETKGGKAADIELDETRKPTEKDASGLDKADDFIELPTQELGTEEKADIAAHAHQNMFKKEGRRSEEVPTGTKVKVNETASADSVLTEQTPAAKRASKLAEKLRKRQEERERLAATKAKES